MTEGGCWLILVDRLLELLLLLGVPDKTFAGATVGPPLLGKAVLDVAEVLAGVGAGGEVLFGAGTLAVVAELLLEGAVEVAPVPGTGVITTLPFTDLIRT